MGFDTRDSTLYCVANGGHWDYSGNEVDAIRLSADAPQWVERLAPSSNVGGGNQFYYPDGRPSSRHTYYTEHCIEARNRVMTFGAPSIWGDGGGGPVVDGWNMITSQYDPAGTYPSAPFIPTAGAAACKDPATENVYVLSPNAQLMRWNQAANTWTTISNYWETSGYVAASACDTTRNRILWVDIGGAGWLLNLSDNSSQSVGGLVGGGAHGMVYVPELDAYLLRQDGSGSTVFRINASTFAVNSSPVTGGSGIQSSENGVYNRFVYAPRLGGVVYCAAYNGNIWFLRTR
ncbi:MAG: hypothetical protein ACREJC_12640 [Tepidisphaeraceae bacterium]